MLNKLFALVFSSPFVFIALAGYSILALVSALTAQYVFGLAPCPLCIYQRIPYVLAIFIGLAGFIAERRQNDGLRNALLALFGINFLANSAIAAFHSGVERKWWRGLEGCSAPDMSGSMEDILARIKAAPVVRCDEIPWADPILGLSMANYNCIICRAIAFYCLIMWFKLNRS